MLKGNELEKNANKANLSYKKDNKALILKIPVPILYTQKGLVAQQSTVDFAGLINGGQFIAFDAKETKSKTSFPLSNIHQHQLNYLELVDKLGGLAFFMIHFKSVHADKAYITPLDLVRFYWYGGSRKSIPIKDFEDSWLIEPNNYLKKVEEIKEILCSKIEN